MHERVSPVNRWRLILVLASAALLLALAACGRSEAGEHAGGAQSSEHAGGSEAGEHGAGAAAGEGGGSGAGGHGEESGAQYAPDQTFDQTRAGARLILAYDAAAQAFTGTVENTTSAALSQVRVEVHLSNGVELGPTTPVDLAPGQVIDVTLPAPNQTFTAWNAHPEVG